MSAPSFELRWTAGNANVFATSFDAKLLSKIPAAPEANPKDLEPIKPSHRTIFPFTKSSSKEFWIHDLRSDYVRILDTVLKFNIQNNDITVCVFEIETER